MKNSIIGLFLLLFLLNSCRVDQSDRDELPKIMSINGDSLQLVFGEYFEKELNNSSSAEEFYHRAVFLSQKGENANALTDIFRALSKDSDNPKMLLTQASIQFNLGIFKEAKKSADLAESLGEESKDLFNLKALLHAQLGEFQVAQNYIKNALVKAPFSADVWLAKGKVAKMMKIDSLNSERDFKKAISLRPSNLEPYQILITNYLDKNNPDSALKYNDLAIRNFTQNVELEINKASILENVGAFDSALVVYEKVIRENPKRLDLLTRVGNIYFNRKNFASAYLKYNTVINKIPKNANVTYLAGLCKEKMGDYTKAQELYISAKVKNPDDPKYDIAYKRVEYLREVKANYYIARKPKAAKEKAQEEVIERKVFKVQPIEKKSSISTNN